MVNTQKFNEFQKNKGFTNKQLAEKILVSPVTIGNIKSGKTRPCYEVLHGCLMMLELSDEEFVECFFKQRVEETAGKV